MPETLLLDASNPLRGHKYDVPDGYVVGLARNGPPYREHAHLYKGTHAEPGWPMCRWGWNRDQGTAYSIWRSNVGQSGICKLCLRRAVADQDPVSPRRLAHEI